MSIAERMTEKLLSDEIISQKEAELVCYGLESIKSDLTGIAMSILIGVCFGRLLEGILLWGLMYPLRKNAGGFHASTRMRCMLLSVGMLIVTFACLIRYNWPRTVYIFITAVSFWLSCSLRLWRIQISVWIMQNGRCMVEELG